MTENQHTAVASPYIVDILAATGMHELRNAYPHPAFERWHRKVRYLLYPADGRLLSNVRELVHLDLLDTTLPGYRPTQRLCTAVPLLTAIGVFLEAIAQEADT